MRKWSIVVLVFFLSVLNSACSGSIEESKERKFPGTEIAIENKSSMSEGMNQNADIETEDVNQSEGSSAGFVSRGKFDAVSKSNIDRKVIYTANLSIRVDSYQDTLAFVENELASSNGYIVESHSYITGENDVVEGTITVRIPQKTFNTFLQSVEKKSEKVVDRSISGQDVTEEYVDLESRLKSKQIVERRLLDFMEKSEKTEDLLRISTDLAAVQEEIEQVKGRMNYLKNKVDLATVTLQVIEDKVNIPQIEKDELNTLEKTKQQFMNSVNFMLKLCSAIFIFIIGSLPVIVILGGLLIIMVLFVRKKQKRNQEKPPSHHED